MKTEASKYEDYYATLAIEVDVINVRAIMVIASLLSNKNDGALVEEDVGNAIDFILETYEGIYGNPYSYRGLKETGTN